MVQSMTGFGSAEKGPFRVEARSVNHRFLEVSVKMPPDLLEHEMPLRAMARERFSRGKVDLFVTVSGSAGGRVRIDTNLARELYSTLRALQDELSLPGTINIETIAGFRDLITAGAEAGAAGQLYEAAAGALDKLREMRLREGESVDADLSGRIERVGTMAEQIALLCPEAVSACRERFTARLRELFGDVAFDEARVLQEASLVAEKTDISEEITRVRSHLGQLRGLLKGKEPAGRKIEFLLQELNREVNTLSAKAGDYRISSLTVEIKAELEKLREQVQNIQ